MQRLRLKADGQLSNCAKDGNSPRARYSRRDACDDFRRRGGNIGVLRRSAIFAAVPA